LRPAQRSLLMNRRRRRTCRADFLPLTGFASRAAFE
jgi:hypothetical protein